MMFSRLLAIFIALLAISKAEPIGFNSHIRPLLSDHCFACHGFDSNAREADLRLDTAEGAFADRKEGPAITPGNLEKSLIWKRITSTDPDDVMPPADHHLKLDAQEKKLLQQWIQEGAKYEEHWTFIPVEKPSLPENAKHPIDALVTEKLKPLDLKLSPHAEKETLIRRLSFDLRGLPPTPQELQTFLADNSPEAWQTLVDSFLADPAFGERFAWPWLDAARYADSNGFQGDRERTMWPWRDWVVDAINRNLPYDDFTVWQIAGDLLPNATHEQKLATGFLRNHAINGEGGSIPEENRVNYVFDMAETVGTVWMGLTFNCCRCHDHKYDPLSQKDYYALNAFFNQTPVSGGGGDPQTKPVLAVLPQEQIEKKKVLQSEITKAKTELDAVTKKLNPQQAAWEKDQLKNRPANPKTWQHLPLTKFTSTDPGLKFKILPDQSLFTSGANPKKLTYTLTAPLPETPITSIRLNTLRHPSMTKGGIARSDSGNYVLTDFKVFLHQKDKPKKQLTLTDPKATFAQNNFDIAKAIDKDPNTGWAVLGKGKVESDHAAIFKLAAPLQPDPDSHLEFILAHNSKYEAHYIGRLSFSHSNLPDPSFEDKADTLLPILKIAADKRSKEQKQTLRDAFLATHPEHAKLRQKITSSESQIANLDKSAPKVMIMADRKNRRKTHILAVGSYQAKGEVVEAATPGILPPLTSDKPLNRLDLAQWLVARNNPLTSRVTINRVWQELFGIGLIKSPEDLGVQSEIPIHPELLDWLSSDFMDSGWDFKKLIKTIVTSEVYQQSSKVDSLALERDPDNRLHARAPRYRLPSWMIRDQALALSGRLIPQIGGAPVKPWQPAGLWSEVTFGKKKYTPDKGEKLRRRSLYTFWRRISAPPMIFDNAKRENCEVGTYQTNSPLHALATLNDPLYLEAARALAYRSHKTNQEDPLTTAFELITSRKPLAEESKIISTMYEKSLSHFTSQPEEATKLLSIGELPIPESPDQPTQAALTSVILSLLNTDEALTKE